LGFPLQRNAEGAEKKGAWHFIEGWGIHLLTPALLPAPPAPPAKIPASGFDFLRA